MPLGRYTTLGIGGSADWFAEPRDPKELKRLIETAAAENIPYRVLGKGSNLLVADQGVEGLVIRLLESRPPTVVRQWGNGRVWVEVEAGSPLVGLVRFAVRNQLRGLEFLAGIPGTAGGAWAMNAGSFGKEIQEVTVYLKTINARGKLTRKWKKDLSFGYRSLTLEPGEIILSGGLSLTRGDGDEIRNQIRRLWARRRATQPLNLPSCGSVFKNPPGDFAGRLIEKVGLKGYGKGGARIAERHANFIVNTGQARSSEVLYLMNLARRRVKKQFGVLLQPEVQLWGCRLPDLS